MTLCSWTAGKAMTAHLLHLDHLLKSKGMATTEELRE